jgi:hypothetical protein
VARSRRAGRARPRDAINSWLEETSFRAARTASATALVLIGAAVAFALLTPGHGAAAAPGTVPGAVRSELAGTGTAGIATAEPRPARSAGPGRTRRPASWRAGTGGQISG